MGHFQLAFRKRYFKNVLLYICVALHKSIIIFQRTERAIIYERKFSQFFLMIKNRSKCYLHTIDLDNSITVKTEKQPKNVPGILRFKLIRFLFFFLKLMIIYVIGVDFI